MEDRNVFISKTDYWFVNGNIKITKVIIIDNPDYIKELIDKTKSEIPIERIESRIEILKIFPEHGNQKLKKELFYDLKGDIENNREKTVRYISGIEDTNKKAYAASLSDFGLQVNEHYKAKDAKKQKLIREEFIKTIEPLAEKLDGVEHKRVRLDLAEIIAREGSEKYAELALDKIYEVGWNTNIPELIYMTGEGVADSLETIVIRAKSDSIKQKAIMYIAEIPENEKREKYLTNVMTSKHVDEKIAIRAVELYVEKIEPPVGADKSTVALDAIMGRDIILGEIVGTTKKAGVERAFELYIENIPTEEKRLSKVHNFLTNGFKKLLKMRKQGYPEGLKEKAMGYIREHIEDVRQLKDLEERWDLLFEIAKESKDEVSLKAIDYIAQTEKPLEGVEAIAQIFSYDNFMFEFNGETKERIKGWALRFLKEYVKLEDKKLARSALEKIADEEDDIGWDRDVETGKHYYEIAKEELEKLPKKATFEEELAKEFGVK